MTLILSAITEDGSIQVSDRLITTQRNGVVKPFDSKSNKSIIFHASDGIASLSYTGSAYVHKTPTDSWIAEKLNGDEFPFSVQSRPFFIRSGMRRTKWPSIGFAMRNLACELSKMDEQKSSGIQSMPIIVAVTGWIWYRRKKPRTFLLEILRARRGKYIVKWDQRNYGYYTIISNNPEGYLQKSDWVKLEEAITASRRSIDEIADTLVKTIRDVAKREATVGPDCMVTSLVHPYSQNRIATAKYVPNSGYLSADVVDPEAMFSSYSPWIVGPDLCMQPNNFIGSNLQVQCGKYSLVITEPAISSTRPFRNAMEIGPVARPSYP